MRHAVQTLKIASASLAEGQSVPAKAAKLMAKTPIPLMPFSLWRWLVIKMLRWGWRRGAAFNQVGAEELLAQPYEAV